MNSNSNSMLPNSNPIIESCSTMSACDKLTMDTMINVAAYSKYISKRDADVETRSDHKKSERRFYKKRILALTKELIKNPAHVNDTSLINSSTAYINACIMHFKFIDLSDTLQKEYAEVDNNNDNDNSNKNNDNDNSHLNFEETVHKIDASFFENDHRNVKKIKLNEKNILEQLFVLPESSSSSSPLHDTDSKPINNIQRVVGINLKDRQFKTKGLKTTSHKNNINNN